MAACSYGGRCLAWGQHVLAERTGTCQPDLAWDALSDAAIAAYHSGAPASSQAVRRVLGLLERQGRPDLGPGPIIDVTAHRVWIQASTDPFGSRNQLIPYLRQIADSPLDEPALWRTGSGAWLLDESEACREDPRGRHHLSGVQLLPRRKA
jgi:hypothetical protein